MQQLQFNFEEHRPIASYFSRIVGGQLNLFEEFEQEDWQLLELEKGAELVKAHIRRPAYVMNSLGKIVEGPMVSIATGQLKATISRNTLDILLRVEAYQTVDLYIEILTYGPNILAYLIDDGHRHLLKGTNPKFLK
jgi:hypothetical protein